MSARAHAQATEVAITCPACRAGARTQADTYPFALAYLCDEHRELWADADLRAHRSGKCPHAPRACVMDRASCVQHVDVS